MKKFKRVFLCVALICILMLGCSIIYGEFTDFNVFSTLKKDPTLFIPLHISLFSIVSILYNFEKFNSIVLLKSITYKLLRIGDFIFSISLFIFLIIGVYLFVENLNKIQLDLSKQLIIISITVLLLFVCILLFFDNILFHKEQKLVSAKDYISEIGS